MAPAVCRQTNDASFLKWLFGHKKASFLQLLCEIPNQKILSGFSDAERSFFMVSIYWYRKQVWLKEQCLKMVIWGNSKGSNRQSLVILTSGLRMLPHLELAEGSALLLYVFQSIDCNKNQFAPSALKHALFLLRYKSILHSFVLASRASISRWSGGEGQAP